MYRLLSLIFILILLLQCNDLRNSVTVATHPEGWTDENAPNFHGNLVLESVFGNQNCADCHGVDYLGGSSGVSCAEAGCHEIYPHRAGWADSLSSNFHAHFIVDSLGWKINACQSCHGSDYDGNGLDKKNCLTCHTRADGPENCSTCHGSLVSPAPPKDLFGNSDPSNTGVGAHQTHLNDTTLTSSYTRDCVLCHTMPSSFSDPAHIDGYLPAEVNFGFFATDSGALHTEWDHSGATCNNVYCHGAFRFKKEDAGSNSWIFTDSVIVGNNPQMKWTEPGTGQAECGTCHGLPPTGHLTQTSCNGCHGRVVDAEMNIINKKLHINGKIDIF